MKPETYFKMRVMRRLAMFDQLWVFKTQMVARLGIPDLIGVYRGRFFAWELKSKEGSPSQIQSWTLTKIQEAGGIGEVVYPENFEEKLAELLAPSTFVP